MNTTCKHSHESLRSCLTCQVFWTPYSPRKHCVRSKLRLFHHVSCIPRMILHGQDFLSFLRLRFHDRKITNHNPSAIDHMTLFCCQAKEAPLGHLHQEFQSKTPGWNWRLLWCEKHRRKRGAHHRTCPHGTAKQIANWQLLFSFHSLTSQDRGKLAFPLVLKQDRSCGQNLVFGTVEEMNIPFSFICCNKSTD